ncbi:9202_t:CDS:2, partial [Dentiscutata heterogama]
KNSNCGRNKSKISEMGEWVKLLKPGETSETEMAKSLKYFQ